MNEFHHLIQWMRFGPMVVKIQISISSFPAIEIDYYQEVSDVTNVQKFPLSGACIQYSPIRCLSGIKLVGELFPCLTIDSL